MKDTGVCLCGLDAYVAEHAAYDFYRNSVGKSYGSCEGVARRMERDTLIYAHTVGRHAQYGVAPVVRRQVEQRMAAVGIIPVYQAVRQL